MLTIHICQMNSSGELFTPSTPTPKVEELHVIYLGLISAAFAFIE